MSGTAVLTEFLRRNTPKDLSIYRITPERELIFSDTSSKNILRIPSEVVKAVAELVDSSQVRKHAHIKVVARARSVRSGASIIGIVVGKN